MEHRSNPSHLGFGGTPEDDYNRRIDDPRRNQQHRNDWTNPPQSAPERAYESGYGNPTGPSYSGGYRQENTYSYGDRDSTSYPRRGYNDYRENEYGSAGRDRSRDERYGIAGRHQYDSTTRGGRDEDWPRGSAYSRAEYDRAQSDWPDRQYGRGAAGLSGYGAGSTGYAYGQSPMGEYTDFGNRNRNPDRHGPKGYNRTDERIREDVCDCFMRSHHFDPGQVEVEVKNGEVTLSGEVEDREDKFNAERAAQSVLGVRDVHNTIRCGGRHNGKERTGSASAQSSATSSSESRPVGRSGSTLSGSR